MSKFPRICTALLLCSAFIFRVLFINIGIAPSPDTSQKITQAKFHCSASTNRRRHFEPAGDSRVCGFPVIEICEEDDDETSHSKFSLSSLLHAFICIFADRVKDSFPKPSFSKNFAFTSADRYLMLQVVRV